jgi:8-oxo-dGTP pyrophosphatase MutT (NUDIX family)
MKEKYRKAKFLENFPLQKLRFRKAVFVVVYVIRNKKIEYLILKRKKHWIGWEFPKGGVEFLETKKMTVRREVKEETGLKILKIKKFNVDGLYKYKKKMNDRKGFIGQTYHLFSAEVQMGKVSIKEEHSDFKWMNFNEAIKKVTWENQKKCLRIVNDYLKNEISRI